ncbi:MAG: hypothetical protein CL534_03145, partial [Ahrensia sp.]|nr:hypothetical protein [Ahrensia sp.]
EMLTGTDKNDFLIGGDGDDIFIGGAGDDVFNGGRGYDILVFRGQPSDFEQTFTSNGLLLIGPEGTYLIMNIEAIDFSSGVENR